MSDSTVSSSKHQILQALKTAGLIPVIRADSADTALRIADALIAGGIRTLEVTLTVPGALNAIRAVATRLTGDVVLGAGTVTTEAEAVDAVEAGARFLVSPAVASGVIAAAQRLDVPALPGALTPTEVLTAHALGGDIIKVFPASAVGGAAYIKALKGPFPHLDLCPTGGVNLETIGEFFQAGAAAVGVGGELVLKSAIAAGEFDRISELARRYVEAVQRARG